MKSLIKLVTFYNQGTLLIIIIIITIIIIIIVNLNYPIPLRSFSGIMKQLFK